MEKRFCPDCGTQIIGEGDFCPVCGRTLNAPAQPTVTPVQQPNAQPMQPVQPATMPQQQVFMQQMPGGMPMMFVPRRNTGKIWGIIGGCFAAAAIITGIILLIVFTGNPAGEVIKDYRYKDIVGVYYGEATIDSIKIGGDYEEIAEHQNLDTEKKLLRSVDDQIECTLYLDDEQMEINLQDPLFMGTRTFIIDDVGFEKGRAKDSTDEETESGDLEDSEINIDYNFTLHEGISRNSEYRIYGTVEISYDLVLFGIDGSYSIEITVDCDK